MYSVLFNVPQISLAMEISALEAWEKILILGYAVEAESAIFVPFSFIRGLR